MKDSTPELWKDYYLDPTEEKFSRFYEAISGYVYTICHAVLRGNEDEAVDAAQATFLLLIDLARNRPEAEKAADIDLVVRRLAVREADKRRKQSSRGRIREIAAEALDTLADLRPSAQQIASDHQVSDLIGRIVDTLPDEYRVPIRLHFFSGMTHQEIADSLGIARSTVTKTIQKGLRRLEPLMQRGGLGRTTAVFTLLATVAELVRPPSSMAAEMAISGGAPIAGAAGGASVLTAAEILSGSYLFPAKGGLLAGVQSLTGSKGLVAAVVAAAIIGVVVWIAPWRPSPGPPPAASPVPASPTWSAGPKPANGPDQSMNPARRSPGDRSGNRSAAGDSAAASPAFAPAGGFAGDRPEGPLPLSPNDGLTTGPRILISGRITFPDHLPAVGAKVALIRAYPGGPETAPTESIDAITTAGTEGRYFLEGTDVRGLRLESWTGNLRKAEASIPPPPPPAVPRTGDAAGPSPAPSDRSLVQDLVLETLGVVRGRVVDEEDRPVPGALIRAVGLKSASYPTSWTLRAESDARGDFLLDLSTIHWGRVQVAASAPGHAPDGRTVSVPEDNVVLRLDSTGATVEGHVFRKTNGRSVEGAIVRAYPVTTASWTEVRTPPLETRTTRDGEFRLSDLPPGRIVLEAEKGDLVTVSRRSEGASRLTLQSGETRREVSLLLRDSHFVAGTLRDPFDNPIENVQVTARLGDEDLQGIARADTKGRYRIEELPDVPVTLAFRHNEYKERSAAGVEVDREDADYVLEPSERATLIGSVIDWTTRQPVSDIVIESDHDAHPVVDASQPGRFTVVDLLPGQTYRFQLSAPGYTGLATDPIRIPAGTATLRQTFELGPAGAILGRVRSIYDQSPLAGVRVNLRSPGLAGDKEGDGNHSVVTDADGRFSLKEIGRGKHTVRILADSPWVAQGVEAFVDFGETTDLGEIDLNRLGTIKGRVVQGPGEVGVPGQPLELVTNFDRKEVLQTVSGPNGEYEFSGLKYIYNSIFPKDRQLMDLQVWLNRADTKDLTIVLGSGTIQGRVFRDGRPCTNVAIRIVDALPFTFTRAVATDAKGRYALHEIPPGRWRLQIFPSKSDYRGQTLVDFVDLEAGQTLDKDYILPSGLLIGLVVDAEGNAMAGARVVARGISSRVPHVLPASAPLELRSGDDGSFQFEGLLPGAYEVFAERDLLVASPPGPVEVPFQGESEVVVLPLRPHETGVVVSTAIDYLSRKGIPEAWCRMTRVDPDAPARGEQYVHDSKRDADGVMTLKDVPAGEYSVEVSANGYSVARHRIVVQTGRTVPLDDVLYEAGALRWALIDRDRQPLPGIPCALKPTDPTSIEETRLGQTNAEGVFVVRGLFPGDYLATATRDGQTVTATVTIHAHDVTQQQSILPPPSSPSTTENAALLRR